MSAAGEARRAAWAEMLGHMNEALAKVLASTEAALDSPPLTNPPALADPVVTVSPLLEALETRLTQAREQVDEAAARLTEAEAILRAWRSRVLLIQDHVTRTAPSVPAPDRV